MSRPSYEALAAALDVVEQARACISQNRGAEREQAREGYEHAVSEELVPAMLGALADLSGDLEARDVERLGRSFLKAARKHEAG